MLPVWAIILSCAFVVLACLLFNYWQSRKNAKKYEWQPDLSHNIIENKSYGSELGGAHLLMTTLPKSQEQLEEEKRAYLKERKNYD
jgi:hypothetical protein